MSKKSVISAKNKSRESFTSRKSEEPSENGSAKRVTQHDVIRVFFQKMLDTIIEDLSYVDQERSENLSVSFKEVPEELGVEKDYKCLKPGDLSKADITAAKGSKVVLKNKSKGGGLEQRLKNTSKMMKEELGKKVSSRVMQKSKSNVMSKGSLKSKSKTSSKMTSSTLSSLLSNPEEEREARVVFKSGGVYEGTVVNRVMHGKGKYLWPDGTIYEGEFRDGFPTGPGEMILPDLSYYQGDFHGGFFHGRGYLNAVSTPLFYNGEWKMGRKHGQGWLMYEPFNWYDGNWNEDLPHGEGSRQYLNGAKYRGEWAQGQPSGQGMMLWENNDFYRGEWGNGLMNGSGEYTWRAFFNTTFAFPVQNQFRGEWVDGERTGKGVLYFGTSSGSRLEGSWVKNFKHGDGYFVCGNGKIVEKPMLFDKDKPIETVEIDGSFHKRVTDLPLFSISQMVDLGFYIDRILEKLEEVDPDRLAMVKEFEEVSLRNTLTLYLQKMREVYNRYATIASDERLNFEPVMVRMFLWQFYQDIEIHKDGLSLVEIDEILSENPTNSFETVHYPFEKVHFWQFTVSLVGIAVHTTNLEDVFDYHNCPLVGVSSLILKKYLDEKVFAKLEKLQSAHLFRYMNLVPIKAIYQLYKDLGEPHSARTFLRRTCVRRGEQPPCTFGLSKNKSALRYGRNLVPLVERIIFVRTEESFTKLSDSLHDWRGLQDFRRLGPRNVLRCLSEVCPLVKDEDVIVNMQYPLTFIEFYQTLLKCIFLVLELEMKKAKKPLVEVVQQEEMLKSKNAGKSKQAVGDEPPQKKAKKKKKK